MTQVTACLGGHYVAHAREIPYSPLRGHTSGGCSQSHSSDRTSSALLVVGVCEYLNETVGAIE